MSDFNNNTAINYDSDNDDDNTKGSHDKSIYLKLDLSDNPTNLPPNLYQPRNSFFQRKENMPKIQQLLLRRNQLDSLAIHAKALDNFKEHLNELSLRENLFTQFPMELIVLKNLTSLSLANNQLESVPNDTLSKLTNLQWLNLSYNKLSDLPSDIIYCSQLKGLDLQSNRFKNFPHSIFYITNLEVLLFHKNKIRCLPPNYDFPPTLNTLHLAFNQLTQIPSTLLSNPPESLTHLHLSGNKLRTISPKFLSVGYEKLVSLDLHTCQLSLCSGKFFERLSKCKELRRLNLAINRLSDLPVEIGLLTQLQWLNLNDNRLTNLPYTMASLIHLVKLGLVQNRLQELPPFMFLHMLELQKLDVRRNQLKYMPPSILALAPRQEVDVHVDLTVPHTVFSTLSNPPCPLEENCFYGHPYGGSLRTLLFYENPFMEHVDGVLCDLEDENGDMEQVQVISMTQAFNVLQASSNLKEALREAILPLGKSKLPNLMYCSHTKFRKSDHRVTNMLSEIDENDDINAETEDHSEEMNTLRQATFDNLTRVLPLKEQCLRKYLNHEYRTFPKDALRLDQHSDEQEDFLLEVLPDDIVPSTIQHYALSSARQCDYCQSWYTESKYQIGYLARLCNNRLNTPIRFNICSMNCVLNATIKLYMESVDWYAKQSLANVVAAFDVAYNSDANTSRQFQTHFL